MKVLAMRLNEVMAARGVSQSELARAVGVTQGTVSKILLGHTTNSRHLSKIAAHLGVTAEWLLGITNDPQVAVVWKAAKAQRARLPVLLPSRSALEQAFLGVLRASPNLAEDELALELSIQLPTVLRAAAESMPNWMWDESDAPAEAAEDAPIAPPARRQA